MTQALLRVGSKKQGRLMKYTDLTATEDIDRDEMSRIVGGGDNSFGQFNSARILLNGEGRAHLPGVLALEEQNGVTSLGQVIQVLQEPWGGGAYPGTNTGKFHYGLDVPPGLPQGN